MRQDHPEVRKVRERPPGDADVPPASNREPTRFRRGARAMIHGADVERRLAEADAGSETAWGSRGSWLPCRASAMTNLTPFDRVALDALDRRLLDEHQRGFPICETPFAEIADRLDCEADEVLRRLAVLKHLGVVSRVGPVFTPGRIGASTLAAMAVPPARLESVAECVNRCPAVNHNYEREHALNLWFVLATPCAEALDEALAGIRRCTGLEVLDLRLERAYHIDLGFPLWRRPPAGDRTAEEAAVTAAAPTVGAMEPDPPATATLGATEPDPPAMATLGVAKPNPPATATLGVTEPGLPATATLGVTEPDPPATAAALDALDRRLVGAIQDGLPLTARPYAAVGERAGLSEAQVMRRLGRLLRDGVIKRMGVVVRHHELGYHANAMVVFDAPDDRVDALGERLARLAPVTLCYRRTRRPPIWPYNLYCMLHGRDRAEVAEWMDELLPEATGDLDRAVLFSRRRFRQRGARYAPDCTPAQAQAAAHG